MNEEELDVKRKYGHLKIEAQARALDILKEEYKDISDLNVFKKAKKAREINLLIRLID